MVSLHFTMYREIAQMLEENAVKLLNSLKNKPLGKYLVLVSDIIAQWSRAMKLGINWS